MGTIEEKIAVMQAYKEGKTIEELYYTDTEWRVAEKPLWDFHNYYYRVKPEPKYVPYDSATEVERDKWVKSTYNNTLKRIISIRYSEKKIHLGGESGYVTLKDLFDNYTYEDGTPCGKLVEE